MSLFDSRVNLKPYEYPELLEYKESIRKSYWVHDEFNFQGDVQDFKVKATPTEQSIIERTMLAIAQIEVAVKTFWSQIHERMPLPEISMVGTTFAECHANETEILTPDGWADLSEVEVGDKVIQFHHEDSTFSVTEVKRKISYDYEGDMYRWHKTSAQGLVTPNHRMLYWDYKDRFQERPASELGCKDSDKKLPEAAKLQGSVDTLSNRDRLRIALQADGNRRYYTSPEGEKRLRLGNGAGAEYDLRVAKDRKKTRIEEILESLDIDYSANPMPSRENMVRYTIRIDDDYSYKKFDWVSLEDKSYKWCEQFIQELAEWDGHRVKNKKDCNIKYFTTDKSCADIAQAVGMGAGYRSHINSYEDERKDTYKTQYTVSFTENKKRVSFGSNEGMLKEIVEGYNGPVHCVTVDSGAIVTRYDGKPLISGNSEVRHMDAYSELLDRLELNERFEEINEIPALADRMKYLSDYQTYGEDVSSDQDFLLSVLLFSIFIEHVSLFSQFLIMLSFDKHEKRFKGLANAVEATSKEEQVHGLFGIELINITQKERPELFDESFWSDVDAFCLKAMKAEKKVLDWIFEEGELNFLPREVIETFIQDKFNQSLESVGQSPMFEVDEALLAETDWFREEILLTKGNDFFSKRGTNYSKMTQSVSEDDLF